MGSCLFVDFKRGKDPWLTDQIMGGSDQKNLSVHPLVHFIRILQILTLIDRKKKDTMEEAVSMGLHQNNLCFCVLVRSLSGHTRNMLPQKGKQRKQMREKNTQSGGGNESWAPPNWPQCLCTGKELAGRHKVWVYVSVLPSFLFLLL